MGELSEGGEQVGVKLGVRWAQARAEDNKYGTEDERTSSDPQLICKSTFKHAFCCSMHIQKTICVCCDASR